MNQEKIVERGKKYYQKNKEKIKEREKEYYQNNKEKIFESQKKWMLENREHYNQQKSKYISERWQGVRPEDQQFRLRCLLRNRLHVVLKGNKKSDTTIKLIGCSFEELELHITKQFQPGMTWKNHGRFGWHIDHIRPCASFNLADPEQQKECFNYTNLQPLWWRDNLKKGTRCENLDRQPA